MLACETNGVRWLEFALLKRYNNITHAVFLADDALDDKVAFFCQSAGVRSLFSPKQVHGNDVKHIKKLSLDSSCDGIYTDGASQALLIRHADCQAALFYDPVKNVIANVHCGWRGNMQNIYAKTVETLKHDMGCRPADILVCISPSLGPRRSEFINYKTELTENFLPFAFQSCFFNLWQMSLHQLKEAGILENHIEIASMCTYDHPDMFYSYRRDKTKKRNITLIAQNCIESELYLD